MSTFFAVFPHEKNVCKHIQCHHKLKKVLYFNSHPEKKTDESHPQVWKGALWVQLQHAENQRGVFDARTGAAQEHVAIKSVY